MSEENTGTALAAAEPPAPRQLKVYAPVESVQGIMDTARFEHLGRVAQVMARAGLMPQSLTHYKEGAGDNAPMLPLDYEVVVARAYLIANQAELWKADPMAVAQCTSIVHGKLMYEGKLVHAIVAARLGIDLIYEFGIYDVAKRDIKGTLTFGEHGERIWAGEMPASADDQSLGVRVLGTLPGEHQHRWIAGSVGMWNKGAKSPWGTATAWPRQLRYMGAREWTRANKPSLLLGIITDDEVEEYELARQVGAVLPASAPALRADFDAPALPAPEKKGRGAKAKPPEPEPEAEKVEPAAEEAEPASEDAPVEEEQTQDDTPASEDGLADVIAGPAPVGVKYMLAADEPDAKSMVQIYQDGEPFTRLPLDRAVAGYPTYDMHPEVEEPTQPEEPPEGVATADDTVAEGEDEDEADEPLPPELKAYVQKVESAATFVEVKTAMADFYGSAFFKAMTPDKQNNVRASTWDVVNERTKAEMPDKPDQAMDVSAFRLWIEWVDDPDAITGTLALLEDQDGFKAKADDFKKGIRAAATARRQDLLA